MDAKTNVSKTARDSRRFALPELLDLAPRIQPSFDPGYRPLSPAYLSYRKAVQESGNRVPLKIGIERENGQISIFKTEVLPPNGTTDKATEIYIERLVKFLLWSRGGWKIYFQGPRKSGEAVRRAYSAAGRRAFDSGLMSRVYEKPFEVTIAAGEDFPEPREKKSVLGGHASGCRIGFDLGASDLKVAAVKDGAVVFSQEISWNPSREADPGYHYAIIQDGLRRAASYLPRVDAIGGSAAGIYVDNQVRVASLFRSVPPDIFESRVKYLFTRMKAEWGVPLTVINDGEVAALAGMMALGEKSVLGLAMGSSLAGGFIDAEGRISGRLDELAFAPVDINPDAIVDEWSGDRGVGASYFSQQAVNRLALRAGIAFPENHPLSERLRQVQDMAEQGDGTARKIFEDIGIYLGYTIPLYEMFYDFRNLLVLGRVMSGTAGRLIMDKADEVLRAEFPDTARRVKRRLLDETSRRVGQAVAAAGI